MMYISQDFSHVSKKYFEQIIGNMGEEALYYGKAYDRLTQGDKWVWNWAAFFFGPLWLAYRRLYFESMGLLALQSFLKVAVLDLFSDLTSNFTPLYVMTLLFMILWGGFGTPFYLMRNNYRIQHDLPVRRGVSLMIVMIIIMVPFFVVIVHGYHEISSRFPSISETPIK